MREHITDTQEFTTKDMPVAERRALGVGDIWANVAQCLKCGDEVRSKNRHHYVHCSCGALGVDGGSWYSKRTFPGGVNPNDAFKDLTIMYDDLKDDGGEA